MRSYAPMLFAMAFVGCSSKSSTPTAVGATDVGIVEDLGPDPSCPPALSTPKARPTKRPAPGPLDDVLRVNHLQLEATHNSYHLQPDSKLVDWSYSHAPLDEQLKSQGVRGLEIDVRWNENCGRFEVLHLPILDPKSTCKLFTDCMTIVRNWSDANQGHHLLFLQIEAKDGYEEDVAEARMLALEKEILSVWPRESILTPDELKGSSSTIAEALATKGWPTLGATRGRVLFNLDDSSHTRNAYTRGRKNLDGRLIFADGDENEPYAAVRVMNDATKKDAIASALKKNQIVRLFAQKSIEDAKKGDTTHPALALANGGHVLSTDFPAKVGSMTWFFEIPGGTPSRCNPLTAPAECTPAAIESPDRLQTP